MKISRKSIIIIFSLIIFAVLIFVLPESLIARPGGGHSYSGGGGGGVGGGGGGGDLIGLLIYLIFTLLPPYISIPLIIIILIVYGIYKKRQKGKPKQVVSAPTYAVKSHSVEQVARKIHSLKASDPNFSRILFLDFVSSLYIKFQAYKYTPQKLKTIHPFLDKSIINSFTKKIKSVINEIVIGSINIIQIAQKQDVLQIYVEINANYTKTTDGKSTRYIITEKWLLERKAGVVSAEPGKMQKLSCPACGAPANFNDAGECEYCGTQIAPGKSQWFVKNRAIVYSDTIKTNTLTTYAPEVGTNYPTIYSPTIKSETHQFAAAHNTDWESYWSVFYHKISSKYFMQIYKNWANLTWKNTRHLLTDRLWESYNFWIEEYKRNGLRNKLDDIKIHKMHVAKIDRDKFYEAITVRIFASTKDYVVNKQGKVVGGSKKAARVFSEYWTFIRRAGVENDDYDMKSCPNCGAPLDKMGQNGVCEYCGSKVTTGEFSWVLAVITQDEEYKG